VESCAHGGARRTRLLHQADNLIGERQIRQRGPQLRDGPGSNRNLAHRLIRNRAAVHAQLHRMIVLVEHPGVVHLGEIVVFRGQPEDGTAGLPGALICCASRTAVSAL
jgi:hypothetical protein